MPRGCRYTADRIIGARPGAGFPHTPLPVVPEDLPLKDISPGTTPVARTGPEAKREITAASDEADEPLSPELDEVIPVQGDIGCEKVRGETAGKTTELPAPSLLGKDGKAPANSGKVGKLGDKTVFRLSDPWERKRAPCFETSPNSPLPNGKGLG